MKKNILSFLMILILFAANAMNGWAGVEIGVPGDKPALVTPEGTEFTLNINNSTLTKPNKVILSVDVKKGDRSSFVLDYFNPLTNSWTQAGLPNTPSASGDRQGWYEWEVLVSENGGVYSSDLFTNWETSAATAGGLDVKLRVKSSNTLSNDIDVELNVSVTVKCAAGKCADASAGEVSATSGDGENGGAINGVSDDPLKLSFKALKTSPETVLEWSTVLPQNLAYGDTIYTTINMVTDVSEGTAGKAKITGSNLDRIKIEYLDADAATATDKWKEFDDIVFKNNAEIELRIFQDKDVTATETVSIGFNIHTAISPDGGATWLQNSNILAGGFNALAKGPASPYINLTLSRPLAVAEIDSVWQEFTVLINTNTEDYDNIAFDISFKSGGQAEWNSFDLQYYQTSGSPPAPAYGRWADAKSNNTNAGFFRVTTTVERDYNWSLSNNSTGNGFKVKLGDWFDGKEIRFRIRSNQTLTADKPISFGLELTHKLNNVLTKSRNDVALLFTAKRYDLINLDWNNPLPTEVTGSDWTYFGLDLSTVIPKLLVNTDPPVNSTIHPRQEVPNSLLIFRENATPKYNTRSVMYLGDENVNPAFFKITGENFDKTVLDMEYYKGGDWVKFTLDNEGVFKDASDNIISVDLQNAPDWQFRIKSISATDVPVNFNITTVYKPYDEYVTRDPSISTERFIANSSTLSKSFTAKKVEYPTATLSWTQQLPATLAYGDSAIVKINMVTDAPDGTTGKAVFTIPDGIVVT
ncbi:MAG: hypothetical protein LBS54_03290, partial [Dysgonamonadaceae bacterium]|nr:hypothetical protein [Dysgonamonadaceae bacterium]